MTYTYITGSNNPELLYRTADTDWIEGLLGNDELYRSEGDKIEITKLSFGAASLD